MEGLSSQFWLITAASEREGVSGNAMRSAEASDSEHLIHSFAWECANLEI